MIHRLYTERKDKNNFETISLLSELKAIPGNENISRIRILNRYDIQGLNDADLEACRYLIFAEAFTDNVLYSLPDDKCKILAVEYLPDNMTQGPTLQ